MILRESSKPCEFVTVTPNAEKHIVYCARVSSPSNQTNELTAPRLIQFLIKHGHWSPFEQSFMTVEINTTRAISNQILRHDFHFQEFSQRYADVKELGAPVMPILRKQGKTNRQGSTDDLDPKLKKNYTRRISQLYEDSMHLYQEMVSNGVATECARGILPLNIPSRIYCTGSVRNFMFYIMVRRRKDTQYEHRIIIEHLEEIFKEQFPVIWEACNAMNWNLHVEDIKPLPESRHPIRIQ